MFEGTITFHGDDDMLTIDFGWNVEPICLEKEEAYRFFHEVGEEFHAVDVADEHGIPIQELVREDMLIGDVVLSVEAVELFLERFNICLERMERHVFRESPPPPLQIGTGSRQHAQFRVNWIAEGF